MLWVRYEAFLYITHHDFLLERVESILTRIIPFLPVSRHSQHSPISVTLKSDNISNPAASNSLKINSQWNLSEYGSTSNETHKSR